MRLKIVILITSLFINLISGVYADYNDGHDAYTKGDYQSAFSEWWVFANQGDEISQNGLGYCIRVIGHTI